MEPKKIDAVFEGGGVKGSALIGAVMGTMDLGYQFENVAGTSAGAIVASLIAARFTASEMKSIMAEVDYKQFKDPTFLSGIPIGGHALSLVFNKGIYRGSFFEDWLRKLLLQKNIRTFKDLIMPEYENEPKYKYKLQVIASDISRGRFLVLPRAAMAYGINPDELDVASSVRMSMSIPYFYEPVVLRTGSGKVYIVDGGILSNYPVWLFDNGSDNPPWPTIGFKLVDPNEYKPHFIIGPVTLFAALFETMMEAHDARYIEDSNFMRTIPIPTLGVQTTDFDLSPSRKEALYNSGHEAAQKFFANWDFEKYKKEFRQVEAMGRTTSLWNDNSVR